MSAGLLTDDERTAAAEEVRRLVAELGSESRAGAALSVSQAAINKATRYGQIGPVVLRKLLEYRHTTVGELLEKHGFKGHGAARDRIHPSIAEVATALGYSDSVAQAASDSVRALHGPDSLTEETAVQLLADADLYLRKMARTIGAELRVAEPASDDLPGGGVAETKRRARRTE